MLTVYLRRDEDARGLLTDALARHGVSPLPEIARRKGGKPYFPQYPHLHFNLSHTRGLCLCGLSDHPVGVDIEALRPRGEGLWDYCLSPEERCAFQKNGGGWLEFYRLFTLKEAWCKYLGKPLGHPARWSTPPPFPYRCYMGEGYAAAVCGEEPPPSLISI